MAEQVTIQVTEKKTINVSDVLGNLKIADAVPTAQGLYILSDVGTYTNLGSIVTTAGKINYAYFDGTTWSLIATDLPQPIVNNVTNNNSYTLDPEQIVPSEALYTDDTLAGDILKRVDKATGENVNYRETTKWKDGTVMTDAKVDGVIFIKKGNKFYKREFHFLNIKWFGVKGDGVTDDTIALQKAFDFQKNNGNGWNEGIASKKIFIPAGIYIISDAIKVYNGSSIEGESKGSVIFQQINKDKDGFQFQEVYTAVNNAITIKRLTIRYDEVGLGVAVNMSATVGVANSLTPTIEDVVCVKAGIGFKHRVNIEPTHRGCYAIMCGKGFDYGNRNENNSFNFGATTMGCYAMLCDIGFYGYIEMATFIGTSADSNRIGFDMTLKGCFLNVGAEGNTEAGIRLKRSERNQIMTNTVSFGANGIELLEATSNNEITGQIYGTQNTGIGVISTGLDMGTYVKPSTGNIFKNVEFAGFEKFFDDEKKYSIIKNGRQRLEKGFQQVLWFTLDDILSGEVKHAQTVMEGVFGYKIGGGRYVGMIINKENNVNVPTVGTLTIQPILYSDDQDIEYMGQMPNSHSINFIPSEITKREYVANPDLCVLEKNEGIAVRITASADYSSQYMKRIKIGLIVEI